MSFSQLFKRKSISERQTHSSDVNSSSSFTGIHRHLRSITFYCRVHKNTILVLQMNEIRGTQPIALRLFLYYHLNLDLRLSRSFLSSIFPTNSMFICSLPHTYHIFFTSNPSLFVEPKVFGEHYVVCTTKFLFMSSIPNSYSI